MNSATGGPEVWTHQARAAYETFLQTLDHAGREAREMVAVGPSSDGGVRVHYGGDHRIRAVEIHPEAYRGYSEPVLAAQVVSAIANAKRMLGRAQRRHVEGRFMEPGGRS